MYKRQHLYNRLTQLSLGEHRDLSHAPLHGPVLNFAEDERLGKRNQAVDILKAKFGEDIIKRGF